MSLSNSNNDQFEPIAVSSLESFDKEYSNRTEDTKPDFDRFKALFEKPEFEEIEADEFKAFYNVTKDEEEVIFKPLFEIKEEPEILDDAEESDNSEINTKAQNDTQAAEDPVLDEPEESPEEKGYREGFEKGIEQGKKEGYDKGLKKGEEEGFKTGEQKGIEQGKQQGLEQGIEEGREKGIAQVREEAVEILNSLEKTLTTADETLVLLVEKYETSIISLIEQIVKKIIMAQIEIDDEVVKPVIIDALKTLVQAEEVVLSVCEDDYEYIEMIKDEFFEAVKSLTSVSVKSDSSIKRGGCKIETMTASISSDIDSRLEVVFEAIKTAGTK